MVTSDPAGLSIIHTWLSNSRTLAPQVAQVFVSTSGSNIGWHLAQLFIDIYSFRTEKIGDNQWLMTWAFPIKESSAKREGYDKTTAKGDIHFSNDFPGCPYCGGHSWTVCSCGHLSCTLESNGLFTCEWCGAQGEIGNYSGEGITAGVDL